MCGIMARVARMTARADCAVKYCRAQITWTKNVIKLSRPLIKLAASLKLVPHKLCDRTTALAGLHCSMSQDRS